MFSAIDPAEISPSPNCPPAPNRRARSRVLHLLVCAAQLPSRGVTCDAARPTRVVPLARPFIDLAPKLRPLTAAPPAPHPANMSGSDSNVTLIGTLGFIRAATNVSRKPSASCVFMRASLKAVLYHESSISCVSPKVKPSFAIHWGSWSPTAIPEIPIAASGTPTTPFARLRNRSLMRRNPDCVFRLTWSGCPGA